MASWSERVDRYSISVAARTVGCAAYDAHQQYVSQLDDWDPNLPIVQNRKTVGVLMGGFQFLFPAITDSVYGIIREGTNASACAVMARNSLAQGVLEVAGWSLAVAASDDPIDPRFIIAKLAVNAITHISLDGIRAGISKARNLGPNIKKLFNTN